MNEQEKHLGVRRLESTWTYVSLWGSFSHFHHTLKCAALRTFVNLYIVCIFFCRILFSRLISLKNIFIHVSFCEIQQPSALMIFRMSTNQVYNTRSISNVIVDATFAMEHKLVFKRNQNCIVCKNYSVKHVTSAVILQCPFANCE